LLSFFGQSQSLPAAFVTGLFFQNLKKIPLDELLFPSIMLDFLCESS